MDLTSLGLAILLVIANGFFVATEFALVKLRPTRLQSLASEGKPGAAQLLGMVQNLEGYLSATQFGVTLSSLGLGWLGEPAFARLLEPLLNKALGAGSAAHDWSHRIAIVCAFAMITCLHIVWGELVPKNFALQKAEEVALLFALPMRAFYTLCYPGIWLIRLLAGSSLDFLGLRNRQPAPEAHSKLELGLILQSSVSAGEIPELRAELIARALQLGEKTARQVMVPRGQIRYIDSEESLDHGLDQARTSGHTWLPMCRGSLDQVEGVVNAKDLFFLLSKGTLHSIAQAQRPVLFVPENVTLEQLLLEFRRRRRQMAVVVDEHGGTSGMVTMADVVSEVVGDVAELGQTTEEVITLPGGRLELPGTTTLEDLSHRLQISFDVADDEITTVAGLLMSKLGRIPQVGDRETFDEYEVLVLKMEGPKVTTVIIQPSRTSLA